MPVTHASCAPRGARSTASADAIGSGSGLLLSDGLALELAVDGLSAAIREVILRQAQRDARELAVGAREPDASSAPEYGVAGSAFDAARPLLHAAGAANVLQRAD